MVKVSVIIPVYNVERYVCDCLDSIINQTLKDIEIICINDGSTDNSLKILKKYALNDNRIIVLDQENGGHAVATNRGIDLATGDYLYLMDSDDVLELNALELCYNKIKNNKSDFVIFKAINYLDSTNEYYETEVYSMNKIYRKVGNQIFNYKDIGPLMFEASVTPWSKLYKRDFIIHENIRFPEGLIFEDNVFFFKALLTAKRISFLNKFLFTRRWYTSSSTMNGDLRFINSIEVANLVIQVFKEKNEYENYKKYLLNNKIKLNFMRYENIKKEYKEDYFKALKEDFIKIYKNKKLYSDLVQVLTKENRKKFEQVLISDNHLELDIIRKMYNQESNNKELLDTNVFNDIIKAFDKMAYTRQVDNRKIFELNQKHLKEILYDDFFYENFFRNLSDENKKIFEQMLISENLEEYLNLREIYSTAERENRLINKQNLLNININEKKILYDSIIGSKSWKITKPLRFFKNFD